MANSTTQLHPPSETKTLWAWTLGTFFGPALLQPPPGTYGSTAAGLLWYGRAHAPNPPPNPLAGGPPTPAVLVTATGTPAAPIVARESGLEDPGHVVIDEVAGQLIALIAIPADWRHAAVSLLLFRAFDIIKPPPVRQFERLPKGTGIMLDDVAAGLLALLVAPVVRLFF